jgi:6-phosphogluconolactonase
MRMKVVSLKTVVALAGILTVFPSTFSNSASAQSTGGFVYVMTNEPAGNQIVQYSRSDNGSLKELRRASTGGTGGTANGVGSLDPLGSQDSLVLSGDGSRLLAVNAGSNEVSALASGSQGLTLLNKVASGGTFPNSLALYGDLVYVLNAHGTPNVTGFRLTSAGLAAIPNATFALPGGTAAAAHDIRFSPDGTRLLVSEAGTNQIDIFELDGAGLVAGVTTQAAAGRGAFGIRFGRAGVLVNAEAGSNSVSSYELTANDTLSVISAAVPDTQAASCWISVTRDGKFAFVSNTGSGTLSAFQVAGNGTVDLESAVDASIPNGHPIDSALASDSAFFYAIDTNAGRIAEFQILGASLKPLGFVTGLPATTQGIAAQ